MQAPMSTPPPNPQIELLSRSPSPSISLTSGSSFDPHSELPPSPTAAGPSTLGLRELTQMAIRDRKARKALKRGASTSGAVSAPTSPRTSLDVGRPIELRRGSDLDIGFARDVVIRGWRVVGGSKWTDMGRVGAYVVYDIEITTISGSTICILRRYTDFLKLRQALRSKHPRLRQAIPALPGKAHMAKFSDKFLAERQVGLQRFLRTVMLHPEMGRTGTNSVVGQWVLDDGRRPSGS